MNLATIIRAKFYITSWWKMVYLLWKQINNTIVPGNGITNSYYDYTNYETLLNEHILNIDISKKTVDFYDFTKKITQYILKRFKTITIKNEEYERHYIEKSESGKRKIEWVIWDCQI